MVDLLVQAGLRVTERPEADRVGTREDQEEDPSHEEKGGSAGPHRVARRLSAVRQQIVDAHPIEGSRKFSTSPYTNNKTRSYTGRSYENSPSRARSTVNSLDTAPSPLYARARELVGHLDLVGMDVSVRRVVLYSSHTFGFRNRVRDNRKLLFRMCFG